MKWGETHQFLSLLRNFQAHEQLAAEGLTGGNQYRCAVPAGERREGRVAPSEEVGGKQDLIDEAVPDVVEDVIEVGSVGSQDGQPGEVGNQRIHPEGILEEILDAVLFRISRI